MTKEFITLFGIFAMTLIATCWLVCAYVVYFVRMRRNSALVIILWMTWIGLQSFASIRASYRLFKSFGMEPQREDCFLHIALCCIGWFLVYQLWGNRKQIYGFINSRDLLLLRQPIDPTTQQQDATKGLFVPSIKPNQRDEKFEQSSIVSIFFMAIIVFLIVFLI